MPIEITMPKLTDTMVEATLAKWLKKEGEQVKPGDMIAEVETDKATQELEAFEGGTIAKIVIPEGAKTPVGALIVVLAKPGENVQQVAAAVKPSAPQAAAPAPAPAAATAPAPAVSAPTPVVPQTPVAVEDHAEGQEAEILHAGKARVSPLARKLADEAGLDVNTVRGTGPDGRIIKRDVLQAIENMKAGVPKPEAPQKPGKVMPIGPSSAAQVTPVHTISKLEHRNIPLSNMRQTIARRLVQSKQNIPHFYLSIDVQMDKLIELRAAANEQLVSDKLTVTDFVARGCAVALTRVPAINASFAETAIIMHGKVDIGIAVALDDGLIVPVIRDAHNKGVRQISQEIKSLAELGRNRKLKADQMTGSTFTISNLGMFGIKNFQAIVNPPESAILAVGGTSWQPVVKEIDGKREVVPAQIMNLTLSADHRVVDGATGAKFLQELKNMLENPLTMLI